MTAGKKASSENTRLAVSGRISAIDSVRWVTRLRAAWLGTYPSSSTAWFTASRIATATVVDPFTTRETVARETPARLATASRVGRSRTTINSLQTVTADHSCVPPRAVLGDPLWRGVVDMHDAEPLGVALCPFKVGHQRPHEVSPEGHSLGNLIVTGPQVPVQILDAV